MSNGRMTGHSTAASTGSKVKLSFFTGAEFCDRSPLGIQKRFNRARGTLPNACLRRKRRLGECLNSSMIGNQTTFCISTAMSVYRAYDNQHANQRDQQ